MWPQTRTARLTCPDYVTGGKWRFDLWPLLSIEVLAVCQIVRFGHLEGPQAFSLRIYKS